MRTEHCESCSVLAACSPRGRLSQGSLKALQQLAVVHLQQAASSKQQARLWSGLSQLAARFLQADAFLEQAGVGAGL